MLIGRQEWHPTYKKFAPENHRASTWRLLQFLAVSEKWTGKTKHIMTNECEHNALS